MISGCQLKMGIRCESGTMPSLCTGAALIAEDMEAIIADRNEAI